jgi:hypothetical protein
MATSTTPTEQPRDAAARPGDNAASSRMPKQERVLGTEIPKSSEASGRVTKLTHDEPPAPASPVLRPSSSRTQQATGFRDAGQPQSTKLGVTSGKPINGTQSSAGAGSPMQKMQSKSPGHVRAHVSDDPFAGLASLVLTESKSWKPLPRTNNGGASGTRDNGTFNAAHEEPGHSKLASRSSASSVAVAGAQSVAANAQKDTLQTPLVGERTEQGDDDLLGLSAPVSKHESSHAPQESRKPLSLDELLGI